MPAQDGAAALGEGARQDGVADRMLGRGNDRTQEAAGAEEGEAGRQRDHDRRSRHQHVLQRQHEAGRDALVEEGGALEETAHRGHDAEQHAEGGVGGVELDHRQRVGERQHRYVDVLQRVREGDQADQLEAEPAPLAPRSRYGLFPAVGTPPVQSNVYSQPPGAFAAPTYVQRTSGEDNGPLIRSIIYSVLAVVFFFVAVQRKIAFGLTAGAVRG